MTDVALYDPPGSESPDFDFTSIRSESFDDLEAAIKTAARACAFVELMQGLAILKIEDLGLWRDGGYKSLKEYRVAQNRRLDLSRPAISRRRKIAAAWMKNRKILTHVSMDKKSGHLLYLDEAIKNNPDNAALVIDHFKKDSVRDFELFSRPARIRVSSLARVIVVATKGNLVLIDGSPAVVFPDTCTCDVKEEVSAFLKTYGKALGGNNLVKTVIIQDAGEAAVIENALKKHRQSK